MTPDTPVAPAGNGQHPIVLVVLSANDLPASSAFFAKVFGWKLQAFSTDHRVAISPPGPVIALRSGLPEGFPAAVPFISTRDVRGTLQRLVAAGAAVEREPWTLPLVGTLARFTDPGGTLYGLTDTSVPGGAATVPAPFGGSPRPPAGTLCSLEMHAPDGDAAGKWFGEHFGWGAAPTLPQFVAFDPGAGIGGVFQSHTPAARAMAYVYVEDVRAKLAEIEAAGGTRAGEPMSVPGLACFGYVREPSGTVMGLIGE